MTYQSNDVSLKEAAERVGVTYTTMLRYVHLGLIRAVRRGGRWRILLEELERFEREGNRGEQEGNCVVVGRDG